MSEGSRIDVDPHWGWVVLRGVAAIAFGVLALMLPAAALGALVLLWGAYALVDGVLELVWAYRLRDVEGATRWPLILVGLLGVAAGLVTFVWPGITAFMLLMVIAFWAVAIGILQIAAAIRIRKLVEREWLLALSGVVSVAFGVLMFMRPGAGALAVVWMIAFYAILFGILLVGFGLRLRTFTRLAF